MAGASRKEYQLLLQLKAALGSGFNSTFTSAMNTTKRLQNTLTDIKKVQNDISGYKKTQDAITGQKAKVQELTTEHGNLQQRLTETAAKEKELEKALEKSRKKTGEGTEEYKRLDSELKKTREDKEKLTNQTDKTTAAIDRAKGKVEEQERKLNDLSKSLKDAGVNTNNLTEENEKLQKKYDDLKNAQEGYAKASADLNKNKEAISATRKELTKTIGVAAAAGAAVYGGAIKPAMEFESAMAGVRKTVEGTPEELLAIQNGIKKMAKEVPMAATEIAAISEAAGQLGINNDNILDFTRVIADLGVATNIAGQEGAAQIARFANIVGMSQNDFNRFGSSVVALGNNFATTEAEILDMSMRLAGAGAQVGMSEADILGLSTALSSVGLEAEAGGSAISKVMIRMSAAGSTADKMNTILDSAGLSLRDLQMMASHDAKAFGGLADSFDMTKAELSALMKSGTDLENFGKIAGMTGDEFRKSFEQDAVGALQSFIGGLADADNAGSSAIEMLEEMGVTEIRLRDALLRAAGAGDLLTDAVGMSSKAWEENNALANEAQQRYGTTESKMQIMKNTLNDVGITIGDMLLPVMTDLLQKISNTAVSVGAFISENKETVATVAKVVTGLLAAKVAFLAVKMVVLQVKGAYLAVKSAIAAYNLVKAVMTAQSKAGAIATLAEAKAQGVSTGALIAGKAAIIAKAAVMKIVTAAQWLWNAAMMANPIFLIITAVVALIAGLIALGTWLYKSSKAQEEANKRANEFRKETAEATSELRNNAVQLEKNGKGQSKLAQAYRDGADSIEKQSDKIAKAISAYKLDEKATESLKEKHQEYIDVVKNRISIIEELEGIERGYADTQLALMDAEDNVKEKQEALSKAIEEHGEKSREAQRATLELESAENRLQEATGKLASEKETLDNKTKILNEAVFEETKANATLQTELANTSKNYDEVNKIIKQLSEEGSENSIALRDQIIADCTTNKTKFNEMTGQMETDTRSAWSKIGGFFKNLGGWVTGKGWGTADAPDVPKFAGGSDSTPDTFIAGDVGGKGGELVTGARGRKVFTAAQTDAIFANINRAKAINNATNPAAPRVPAIMERVGGFIGAIKNAAVNRTAELTGQPPREMPTRGGEGGQQFIIQYSPTIYVDGGKAGDLEEKLKKNNESLLAMFKEFLRAEREKERRTAYA